MEVIKVKTKPFYGNYKRVFRQAEDFYKSLVKNPKKVPYIRVSCFKREKVFLNLFWKHLKDKRRDDRKRRLAFYACAIELLLKARVNPDRFKKVSKKEYLYRFEGTTTNNEKFSVQIKESKSAKCRYLISVFPN